jgi:hypothetical protein
MQNRLSYGLLNFWNWFWFGLDKHENQFGFQPSFKNMAAAEEKKNMLRLHVDDSQMEWVCEQHQKGNISLYKCPL